MSETPFTAAAARVVADSLPPPDGFATCKGCLERVEMNDDTPHVCKSGPNAPKPFVSFNEPPRRASRWLRLEVTSNSGKQLFCCTICGRTSPTPDRLCPSVNEAKSNRCYRNEHATTTLEGLDDAQTELVNLRFHLLRFVAMVLPRENRRGFWDRENIANVKEDWITSDLDIVKAEVRRLRAFRDEVDGIASLAASGLSGHEVHRALQHAIMDARGGR